jgi:hypothetical protein
MLITYKLQAVTRAHDNSLSSVHRGIGTVTGVGESTPNTIHPPTKPCMDVFDQLFPVICSQTE